MNTNRPSTPASGRTSDTPPGRAPLYAFAVVVAAYLLCALPRLTSLPRVNVDEPWMMQFAWQLRSIGRITLPMFNFNDTFILQPGYSVVMAPWMALFGGDIYAARLLSVIFGLLTLVLVFRGGWLLESAWAGVAASVCLAMDSNFLGAVRSTRHDIMSMLFAAASLCLLLEGRRTGRRAWFLGAGLAGGTAMIFHANAYWAVAVAGLWILTMFGWRIVMRPEVYLYGAGLVIALLPILLRLDAYRRQLSRFVGNITPSLDPAQIAAFIAAEPERYRYWYFGLVTTDGATVWLRLFQCSIVAGLLVLAVRLVRTWRGEGNRPDAALPLIHVGVSVFLFAGFVPNKAVAYLPHLLLGFAWVAGIAWAAGGQWLSSRMDAARGRRFAIAAGAIYLATGVLHYQLWFRSATTATLPPYEQTTSTIGALLPAGPKYVIAFPTFWLPFRDDSATTFYAVYAVTPPGFHSPPVAGFQMAVSLPGLTDKPVYVLYDEAHWGPMMSLTDPYRAAWKTFVLEHCSAEAVAPATAYGTLVSYRCAADSGKPQIAERWIAGAGARWQPRDTVWEASPQASRDWELNDGTQVSPGPGEMTVTADAGGGVCHSVPVREGSAYLLSFDANSSRPTDLLSVAHAAPLDAAPNAAALPDNSALWRSLARSPWYPQEQSFVAVADSVRLCFYSDTATAFQLGAVRLSTLERQVTAPGRNTP